MAIKKTAKAAPKKSADTPPKPPRQSVIVSSNVKVVPEKSRRPGGFVNEKLTSGADRARLQNEKKMAEKAKLKAKALKAANKPTKGKADITKGELAKTKPARSNRVRGGGIGGGGLMNWDNK